jgi:hypothetical protein
LGTLREYWTQYRTTLWSRLGWLALLIPSVVLAVLFWHVHALDPLTASALVVDRALQVATIVGALFLPFLIFAMGPLRALAATIDAAIGLALGATVATSLLRPPFRLLPSAIALTAAAGALMVLWAFNKDRHFSLSSKLSVGAFTLVFSLVQFWHASSFIPANLNTSVTATPKVLVESADQDSFKGVITIALRNRGGVGARVLNAEAVVCFSPSVATPQSARSCRTHTIIERLSVIDSNSVWTYHQAFTTTRTMLFVSVQIHSAFIRFDRARFDGVEHPFKAHGCTGKISVYPISPEARYRGVAQSRRYLVYDDHANNRFQWAYASGSPHCEGDHDLGSYLGNWQLNLYYEDWLTAPKV